jgi:predicted RNA binding protein YcfA (HicA-like mRNA interferase family)
MEWGSARAVQVLKALLTIGWRVKRQRSSHRILVKRGYQDYTFAFHDREEIGPRMLARIARHTGLTPGDL